jgi:PAS domain-containing protein
MAMSRLVPLLEFNQEGISPRIQRVLDALEFSPAFVKTVTWDLVAWNRAASALFAYDALALEQRNILRRIFFDPQVRAVQLDWQSVARFAVAAFRADIGEPVPRQMFKSWSMNSAG